MFMLEFHGIGIASLSCNSQMLDDLARFFETVMVLFTHVYMRNFSTATETAKVHARIPPGDDLPWTMDNDYIHVQFSVHLLQFRRIDSLHGRTGQDARGSADRSQRNLSKTNVGDSGNIPIANSATAGDATTLC
eukprot:gb/GECG01006371.1/.p1 GENE.gb/GECG01006371.1/~~gb/GECG01006371.1/.p1  ORF type:complete len:134 (+),score=7.35 gb/GECG01006371.1/:1-402(+)